ncbi:MAG: hypothetical protein V1843_01230, partial [bacterium]
MLKKITALLALLIFITTIALPLDTAFAKNDKDKNKDDTEISTDIDTGYDTTEDTTVDETVTAEDEEVADTTSSNYTGLIVDARGLNIYPALAPKIYDANGNEIFGTFSMNHYTAVKRGIVEYFGDYSEALAAKKIVGNNPLVVRAYSKGRDPYGADIVLTADDADTILEA